MVELDARVEVGHGDAGARGAEGPRFGCTHGVHAPCVDAPGGSLIGTDRLVRRCRLIDGLDERDLRRSLDLRDLSHGGEVGRETLAAALDEHRVDERVGRVLHAGRVELG